MSAGLKANSDGTTGAIQLNGTDVAQITSAGIIAPNIHAANIKTTPVGNDEFGVWDSVSGLLNRLSWTNFLASLRATANTWTQPQTFSADTSLVSVNGGQLAGFRNILINGGMQVQQRPQVNISAGYQFGSVDRWMVAAGGTSTAGVITAANVSGSFLSGSALAISNYSSTGTGTSPIFMQRIEQKNCYALRGKTITVSATIYHNQGTTIPFSIGFNKFQSLDVYGTATSLTAATMSVSSCPSGTTTRIVGTYTFGATDCDNGIAVYFYGVGNMAFSAATLYLADVQLEVGSVATPFEQRPYGLELQLCQRYYETGIQRNWCASPGTGYSGISSPFKVTKRVQPTIVPTGGPSGTVGYIGYFSLGNGTQVASTAWSDNSTTDQVSLPLVSNVSCYGTAFQWTASAEL